MGTGEVDNVPDFRWPHRVTELIFEWLQNLWESLADYAAAHVRHLTFLGWVQVLIILGGVAYLAILWIGFCYIRFPVSPYGVWDIAEWVMVTGSVVWGAIGVYFGGALLLALLWLMVLVTVYFTLSLGYLCWTVWNAHRRQSRWLKRYRVVMMLGMALALALATFVDGAYRFWDAPFTTFRWVKFAVVGASAWAALFCHLTRGNVRHRGTPRRIVTWTVSLALAVGVLGHGLANQGREEYFLRKNVTQHPNDSAAWVELARHYEYQGDVVANDSGDEDHKPGDPTPWYEDALDSINRAIELGASGFEVYFSRAKLADEVGQKRAAIGFAQEALRSAPADPIAKGNDNAKWLQEMVARNTSALPTLREEEQREHDRQQVLDRRQQRLPLIVRWVFDSLEN